MHLVGYIESVISEISQSFDLLEIKQQSSPDFYRRYVRLLSALVNMIDQESESDEDDDEDEDEDEDSESGEDSDKENGNDNNEEIC